MIKILDILKKNSSELKPVLLLIDPDKSPIDVAIKNIETLQENGGAGILVGSSILLQSEFDLYIESLKKVSKLPLILFPGDVNQVSSHADAIFLLSLVSGRNPDYLISKHVQAAFNIKKSGIEVIPTAYLLVDGGSLTSVQYVTQTLPIPNGKADLAAATALASEQLGMQVAYLEAGSGANMPVQANMIEAVKSNTNLFLVVGGGLRTPAQIKTALNAGANLVVIGTAVEENAALLKELLQAI